MTRSPADHDSSNHDTGQDSIHRNIWTIAGPALIANSSTPLVGLVDTWAIGHLPDPVLLGAIALGGFVFSYIYWAFGFLRMSTTGQVAQAFGAQNDRRIDRITFRSLQLGLILGLSVLVLQAPISKLAFAVFGADGQLADNIQRYLDIRIWAAPAVLMRIAIVGFLIGTQRARLALLLELTLNLSNAALSITFVVGLKWQVAGVAAGSLIAEWLALLVAIIIVIRLRGPGFFQQLFIRQTWQLLAFTRLLTVNAFLFVRTLFLLGVFACIYRASSAQGDIILAANHVLLTFTTLISLGLDAIAYATEAYVGESIGRQSQQRLRRYVYWTTVYAFLMSLVYALVFGIFGNNIIAFLTDQQAVRAAAGDQLLLFALLPLLAVWSYQLDGIFIGATRFADMMWTMIIAFSLFIPCLYLLSTRYDNHGLWLAFLFFFIIRGISLGTRYPRLQSTVV